MVLVIRRDQRPCNDPQSAAAADNQPYILLKRSPQALHSRGFDFERQALSRPRSPRPQSEKPRGSCVNVVTVLRKGEPL